MISSIVLKPTKNKNSWFARFENFLEKISGKLLNRIHAAYSPILRIALKRKAVTLVIALAILGSAVFVFSVWGANLSRASMKGT